MDPVLRVAQVSKSFWGIPALDRVSLDVLPGEVHAVTGENGAGKSTLMKIIAGVERADAGAVLFGGREIAMIHQELEPYPELPVAENIWMGRQPARWGWLDRAGMRRQSQALLERLGVAVDPDRRMASLSIAEQQAVEIARALARGADLIIMDEPTSALSAQEAESLLRVIQDLRASGVTVLYISHRLEEIFRLADTITVLRDGRHITTRPAGELDEDTLIAVMVGRPRQTVSRPATGRGTPAAVALEVRGLARRGRFRDVHFSLARGEILGLAGLMGAGRTDVAAAIFGLAPATSGTIAIGGRAVRIQSPCDALACGIAMVTEDRRAFGIVPDMSVKDNLTLSTLRRYCWGPFLKPQQEAAAASEQMERFDVRAASAGQPARWLSGGNQQKMLLARALLTDPRILLLDEPTRGIDVGAKAEIHALIAGLARQGKAILLVSSEMEEIFALSDRILVMREGAIAGEFLPGATTPEEILRIAMPIPAGNA